MMRQVHIRCPRALGLWAIVGAIAATTPSCTVNPATGQRQLTLMSESQEIALGRQSDAEIVASMGLYEDGGVQEYVAEIGRRMAEASERPDLPWTFRVLDDPVVNAFALPGGYVYVTRGIMSYMSSEAELASVLGHEIGHVTGRHGVERVSKAQLATIGLGVGMVVSEDFRQLGGLAQTGLGLLFLKYSRDDEREADRLGLRYMTGGGYDAREAPGVFDMLGRVSDASGAGRVPGWLSTHPDPGARAQTLRAAIAESGRDYASARVGREPYFQTLDGMVFGANPRHGYFDGQTFLHPDMRFQVDFPEGWPTVNQRQAVIGQSPENDARLILGLAEEAESEAAARRFAAIEGIQAGSVERGRINGLESAGLSFDATSGETEIRGQTVFIEYGGRTFQLLGLSLKSEWSSYRPTIQRSLGSFAELRDQAALDVQPARIDVVEVPATMSLEEFQRRFPSNADSTTVALINGLDDGASLPAGSLAKRIVGGPPASGS